MLKKIKSALSELDELEGYTYSSRFKQLVSEHSNGKNFIPFECITRGNKRILGGTGIMEINFLRNVMDPINKKYLFKPTNLPFNNLMSKNSLIADVQLRKSIIGYIETEEDLEERISAMKQNILVNILPFFERFNSLEKICNHISSYTIEEVSSGILYNTFPLRQFDAIALAKYGGLDEKYVEWIEGLNGRIENIKKSENIRDTELGLKVDAALEELLVTLNQSQQIFSINPPDQIQENFDHAEQADDVLTVPDSLLGFIIDKSCGISLSNMLLDKIFDKKWKQVTEIELGDAIETDMSCQKIAIHQGETYTMFLVSHPSLMEQIVVEKIKLAKLTMVIYGMESTSGLQVLRKFEKGEEVLHHVVVGSDVIVDNRSDTYPDFSNIKEEIFRNIKVIVGTELNALPRDGNCYLFEIEKDD